MGSQITTVSYGGSGLCDRVNIYVFHCVLPKTNIQIATGPSSSLLPKVPDARTCSQHVIPTSMYTPLIQISTPQSFGPNYDNRTPSLIV